MKRPNADIDRAIASALNDVTPERVSNWCAHIRTRQVGVSFLGQQVGLPIGPKEVTCTKLGGSIQAQMYSQAAETFFTSNCAGCQFREPVSDDNIGEAIITAAETARENERAAAAEREVATDAARELADPGTDPEAILQDDPSTDAQIRALIGALADEAHGREAAKKLKRAADRWPDLFSQRAAEVMCGMIRDGRVGDLVLATAWTLSAHMPSIRNRVLQEATGIVEERWYGPHPMVASDVLTKAILADELSTSEPLVDGVVLLLRPLVEPPWPRGFLSDREPEETPADRLFAALAEHQGELTLRRVDALLLSDEPSTRAHAATAAARLAGTNAGLGETILRLANRLLDALTLIDDEEEADLSLLASLAACRDSAPEEVTRLIFQRLPTQDLETAKLAVRSLHVGSRHARTTPPIELVTSAITNRDLPIELRADLADGLADIGRDDPEALWKSFDGLLLMLVRVAQERSEILAAGPSGDSTEEFYEIQFARTYSATLRLKSVEAVASAVLWSPEEGIRAISEMLTNAATGPATALKAALLEVLGEVGEEARDFGRQIVPVVYPHILDPDSHTVRGAAVRALEHLVRYNRNVLPDDVLLLVAQLFHDQYLHPVISGAVDVFSRAQVRDRNLAWQVFAATVSMYRAYANDGGEYEFIRSLSDVQLNLCRQHEDLVPYAAASMGRMSDDAYYYTASRVLQDFGYLARWYPQAHDEFLTKVIDYHRRFNIEIAYGGQYLGPGLGDDRFEDLFDLAPSVVRARSQGLLALAREGASHRNPEYVAALLLALAAPEAADAFQLAASRLPEEGQYEPLRAKLSGVEALLRAELAVARDDLNAADSHLRDAISSFEDGQERPSKLPFGLGMLPGERNGFLSWARLRRLWVSLPGRAASLGEPLAEVRERLQGLPEERTTRDESIRRIAAALVDALENLSRWHSAVRSPDANAPVFRQAGIARLHDALEETNSDEVVQLLPASTRERIQEAIDVVEEQAGTASLAPVIDAFRRIPFPVPIEDLPVPRDWKAHRGDSHPVRPTRRDSGSADGVNGHRLARVSAEIDGEAPSDIVSLVAGRIYDIGLTFELDELPGEATELVVQHVCRLPAGSYHFPEETLAVDAGKLRYTVSGTVRFDSPQSDASQPVEIKLLLHAARDNLSLPYELVGLPPLRIRVLAAPATPTSASASGRPSRAATLSPTGEFPPPIHLTCRRDGARHEVLVDGASVMLTDQHLTLLLRLINQRLRGDDGWVDLTGPLGAGLVDGGYVRSEADKAINRLRNEFKSVLAPRNPKELIRVTRGQVRIETPPHLTTWDEAALLNVGDALLAQEARVLVDATAVRSDR